MICADCHHAIDPEQEMDWPDAETDGVLCQECWELQCSEAWWDSFQGFVIKDGKVCHDH